MASTSTSSLNPSPPIWKVESLTKHIIHYKSSKKTAEQPSIDVDSLPSTDVDSLPELDSHEIDGTIPNDETISSESNKSFTDPVPAKSSQEEVLEPSFPNAEIQLQEKLRKNLERAMEQQSKERQRTRPLSFSMPGIITQSTRGYEMNAWIGSAQARRTYMEDRSIFKPIHFMAAKEQCHAEVGGVFDGHGTARVAQFIQSYLHVFLQTTLEMYNKEGVSDYGICKALRATFKWLHRLSPEQTIYHGSTAIVAFIFNQVVWMANAGDCRAIFCPENPEKGICVTVTEDASLHNPRFIRKVEKLKGKIIEEKTGFRRVKGILGLGSSLGDHQIVNEDQQCCIPHTPIVTCIPQEKGILLLASDGVWHGFSSMDVAKLIREIMSKTGEEAFIAQGIVSSVLAAGESDNISVVVIPLSKPEAYEGTKKQRHD